MVYGFDLIHGEISTMTGPDRMHPAGGRGGHTSVRAGPVQAWEQCRVQQRSDDGSDQCGQVGSAQCGGEGALDVRGVDTEQRGGGAEDLRGDAGHVGAPVVPVGAGGGLVVQAGAAVAIAAQDQVDDADGQARAEDGDGE